MRDNGKMEMMNNWRMTLSILKEILEARNIPVSMQFNVKRTTAFTVLKISLTAKFLMIKDGVLLVWIVVTVTLV